MINTTTKIVLTDEQCAAVDSLCKLDRQVQTLGGLAGTGKSTIVKELVEYLPNFAVCAYTGKAANVLRRKGLNASTIHSLIYKPIEVSPSEVEFELRSQHEAFFDGFIVDEASMVGKEIDADLRSFELPIIYIGDHGQLEPIGATDFNLMRDPQLKLETIHRNAGEIARFAEHLRNGGDARDWNDIKPDCERQVDVITGRQLQQNDDLTSNDQIVCAYNWTRNLINNTVREHLGLPAGQPVVGDRVICLQNDREEGVFNGMQGVITRIDHKHLSFSDEDAREFRGIIWHKEAFGSEKTPKRQFGVIPFDWSYCVTAHKMQGSEADNVLVLEQRCGLWDHKRWAYTAASRAKRKLTWVLE